MSRAVLERVIKADGWIARPTCPPELIAMDLAEIAEAREERQLHQALTVAHVNFAWLSEQASHDAVTIEQQERFSHVVSDERPWGYIDAVYLTGSIDEVQQKVQARRDAGVEYLMLHTLTADLGQLDLMAKHILEPFRDA